MALLQSQTFKIDSNMQHPDEPVARYETPEEIVAHISRLMAEAEAMLVGPEAEKAGGKLDEMKSRVAQAQSRSAELYGSARKKIVAGAKLTDETIRAHPYEALAITLGVGVLLGVLIGRTRD
jgi:ElaB/YqjD/DUF883 family membrane-anchored ribosome-binding protein